MVERWKVKIPRLSGEKERTAYAYLPVGFDETRRYPVLYMFDGHNLFSDEEATYGKCWGTEDYLDYTNTQIIVAAVECNDEGNERLSEYSPVDLTWQKERIVGKGEIYMDWLVGEFKPYIDDNYPTLTGREDTAIAGSSMGGLMTMYALARYGEVFSKGAALSPSLWTGDGAAAKIIKEADYASDTKLYMDCGSEEMRGRKRAQTVFCDVYKALVAKGVNATARIAEGGTHCEASWERQIPVFMKILGFDAER